MMATEARYDVFLSYTHADEEIVKRLAARLADEQIRVFLSPWHLVPGQRWQEALEEALELSNACAGFIGPTIGPWQNSEMRAAVDHQTREPGFQFIPVLLPDAAPIPAFLSAYDWVDFRNGVENETAFRRLVAGIRGTAPGREPELVGSIISGEPYAVALGELRALARPQFERTLLLLAVDQSAIPRYSSGQDARAAAVARMVATGAISLDRLRREIANARKVYGIGATLRFRAWSLVAAIWKEAYEWLAKHEVVDAPFERQHLQNYHDGLILQMRSDKDDLLVAQAVIDERKEASPSDQYEPRQREVRRIRNVLRELAGVAHGGDHATARLPANERRSRVVRDAVRTLLRSSRPVILLGEPGAGKSMTLREVAHQLARQKCRGPQPPVVVFCRLGSYTTLEDSGPGDVIEFIRSVIQDEFVRSALPTLIAEGRLVVLFDGMDEMERTRYDLRVQALSQFATAHEGLIRTLFSCRVNDFLREFQHRQLILMEFGPKQITEFLQRNVELPKTVDGVTYTRHRHLAKDLATRPGLAELITNPLTLSLTCAYFIAEQRWPVTRASLFDSYIARQLKAKVAGARIALDDGEQDALLEGWSRIAYALMKAKRGEISFIDAATAVGPAIERVLAVGILAGILESASDGDTRLRFVHHRIQEYFAARFLSDFPREEEEIDWDRGLDVPAWQESLLYLASMRPECRAMTVLERSLREPLEQVPPLETSTEEEKEPTRLDPHLERLWGDRVLLASHVVREAAAQQRTLPERFRTSLDEALRYLAEAGRPTSHVKMLWAWGNAPSGDATVVLRKPLKSELGWVQDQATAVLTSVTQPGVVQNRGIDLSRDYADERVLQRLRFSLPAARAMGKPWVDATIQAASCHLLFWCITFAAAAGMLLAAVQASAPYPELRSPPAALLVTALAAIVIALVPFTRTWLPGVARNVAGASIVTCAVWLTVWTLVRQGFVRGLAEIVTALVGSLALAAIIMEALFWLFAWLLGRAIARASDDDISRMGRGVIRLSKAGEFSERVIGGAAGLVGLGVVGLLLAGVIWLFGLLRPIFAPIVPTLEKIGSAIGTCFSVVLAVVFWIFIGAALIRSAWEAIRGFRWKDRYRWLGPIAGTVLFVGSLKLFGLALQAPLDRLIAWLKVSVPPIVDAAPDWMRAHESWFAIGIAVLLATAMAVLIAYTHVPRVRATVAPLPLDPAAWKLEFRQGDAMRQVRLLQIDRSQLDPPRGLRVRPYIDLLSEVEDAVLAEPAASAYWVRRLELDRAMPHEEEPNA